ncbi:MAG TPA: alpha/beta hydrolase [Burkholderiaceae bacterium]
MAHTELVDGIEVEVAGTGQDTIVMVHGWPDNQSLWDTQVAAFAPYYRCVRFTLPGFGATPAGKPPTLVETVALLHAIVLRVSPDRPVTLMLHDWGCLFGYAFQRAHPALVSRVVGVDIGDAGSHEHLRAIGISGKLMLATYQLWLALLYRIGGSAGDALTRAFARTFKVPGDLGRIGSHMNYPYYIAWFKAYGSYDAARPPLLDKPFLYIYGKRKPFMFHSPQWLAQVAGLPGSRVIEMDSDHWPMLSKAEEFNAAVLGWLRAEEQA